MKGRKGKFFDKRFAVENIKRLFSLAEGSKEFSDRYVFLARKVGMKFRTGLPLGSKFKFCKGCFSFFRVGENCRVRIRNGKIVYLCFKCNKIGRFGFTKTKKKSK